MPVAVETAGNNADNDDDNGLVLDVNDAFPLDATESVDTESDGVGDNSDAFPFDSQHSDPGPSYSVGGTVTGLTGSVVLQNTGFDDLIVNSNGSFSFVAPVADTSSYSVTVYGQPAGLTCFAGSGSGQVGGANITSVSVFCSSPEFDADAVSDTVTLDWVDVGAGSYNRYYSSASDCDIANYASCPDGSMLTNVTPPYTVTDLGVECSVHSWQLFQSN